MGLISRKLESRLREKGLWPEGRVAWASLYVLALDLFLFAVQLLASRVRPSWAASLGGWVTFLSILAIVLLAILALRWLRAHLLWRLRNRLIVTYVFIGVIPVILLVVISLISLYLFAGQFARFLINSDISAHLRSLEASNRAIAHSLASQFEHGERFDAGVVRLLRPRRPEWTRRQVCVWYREQPEASCSGPEGAVAIDFPSFITGDFHDVVRDHGRVYLRVATIATAPPEALRVVTSEPLDKNLIEEIAGDLGKITVSPNTSASGPLLSEQAARRATQEMRQGPQTFSVGTIPPAANALDLQVEFSIPLQVVEWATGEREKHGSAVALVETRPSILYATLFAALDEYAQGVEYILWSIALVFAVIELLALIVGVKLTRSITSSVADLDGATTHVNRGDFSHRIRVESSDQLATLANSFNSMTASIERLVLEHKEKQRMENELSIAQEVQAQLFPKEISQLESLDVHGFCRPARTVSGDYYDFLTLDPDKMILAVGDISGKGISAALMMATIHSAVRAYSTSTPASKDQAAWNPRIEGIPLLREPAAVGAGVGRGASLAHDTADPDVSPAALLGLLNHQLYQSTPAAKYATLFLGIYDGASRRFTYSNGGHLPPILISADGTVQLLSCGGTVIGLLDDRDFPEATVELHHGDLLVAYSDGVTEPENDYGEFGEQRLIEIVRENRHLPLDRITAAVTAAVDDWIGDKEQPDDVTLVLARAR